MKAKEYRDYMDRGQFRIEPFENPAGKSFRVYGWTSNGARIRKNFKTHDEAIAEKQRLEIEAANEAAAGRTVFTKLTPEQVTQAEIAYGILGDRPIVQAASYYVDNYREPISDIAVPEAIEKFIKAKEAEGCRKGTLRNFNRLSPFKAKFHARQVSSITRADVIDFLKRDGVSAVTKDGDRRALSSFFSWCANEERQYCTDNPAIKKGRSRHNGTTHSVTLLTMAEVLMLLRAAAAYKAGKLVPFVTLSLFCGIRPDELKRLSWRDIDLDSAEIHISPEVSKIKSQRTVAISANALEWILPHALKQGSVAGANWRKDFDAVKRLAGFGNPERRFKDEETDAEKAARKALKPWPQDAMRHTALSFHVREHGSEEATATWAGNSVSIIRNHYKGKVTKADSKTFWSITPDHAEAKIVRLATA